MAEYIELDTPLELYVVRGSSYKKQISTLRDLLDTNRIPYTVADVRPVRHGRWLIKTIRGDKRTVCSECLLETGTCYEENFCPNCGAQMERSEE